MRVLVGYEFSGTVRRAFAERGHDAWSCDLQPAADESENHFQCDIFDVVDRGWDLAIFHPPCTYLTCSAEWAYGDGPYHQKVKPGTLVGAARRAARDRAIEEVKRLVALPIRKKVIENPIGVLSKHIGSPAQVIQPFQFGEDASKSTALWLWNLPRLRPTGWAEPRSGGLPLFGGDGGAPRWANQTDGGQNRLPPSDDRWAVRSLTYPGIAKAMAEQWG